MSADSLAGQMRIAASSLLASLDGRQRELAALSFADDAARRWLEYRPRSRPGACIAELSGTARKAAHRLLATGLSEHAYAQAMGIVALEEVLDRKEQWRRGRHSGDYWVSVYGDPEGDQPWSWRTRPRPTSAAGPAPGPARASHRLAYPRPGSGRPRGPCWPSWSRSTWTGCPRNSRLARRPGWTGRSCTSPGKGR